METIKLADVPTPKAYHTGGGAYHIEGDTVVELDDGVYRIGVSTDGD